MIIKADKWYKRAFLKLMWKLRIWKPPKYGHGVYKEQGIQLKTFDVDTIVDNINKHDGSYESLQRISDAARGMKIKESEKFSGFMRDPDYCSCLKCLDGSIEFYKGHSGMNDDKRVPCPVCGKIRGFGIVK